MNPVGNARMKVEWKEFIFAGSLSKSHPLSHFGLLQRPRTAFVNRSGQEFVWLFVFSSRAS